MKNSHFNKLCAEMRNKIYELALTSDKSLSINKGTAVQPPLTRVCKQIRSETLLLLYSVNNFTSIIKTLFTLLSRVQERRDEAFLDSVDKIIEWARATPKECHQAIPLLTLTPDIHAGWLFNPSLWTPREGSMLRLRKELRRRGYGDDRVGVKAKIPRMNFSGGLSFLNNSINFGDGLFDDTFRKARNDFKKFINSAGFECMLVTE